MYLSCAPGCAESAAGILVLRYGRDFELAVGRTRSVRCRAAISSVSVLGKGPRRENIAVPADENVHRPRRDFLGSSGQLDVGPGLIFAGG